MQLFDSVITPTILYDSECWVMTFERQRELRTTQRPMLRTVLGSGRKPTLDPPRSKEDYVERIKRAKRQSEQAMKANGVTDWVQLQRSRLWKWAGKVARLENGRWSQEVLKWDPEGCRAQGRPRTCWTD